MTTWKGTVGRHTRRHDSLTYHTIPHVILTYVFFDTQYSFPDSDRCDTPGLSVPVIIRFNPVLGRRTILHLLECRTSEFIAFSVPDRNALWNRVEDDLLMESVVKYSISDVLGRDWREVTSEFPGRLPQ